MTDESKTEYSVIQDGEVYDGIKKFSYRTFSRRDTEFTTWKANLIHPKVSGFKVAHFLTSNQTAYILPKEYITTNNKIYKLSKHKGKIKWEN